MNPINKAETHAYLPMANMLYANVKGKVELLDMPRDDTQLILKVNSLLVPVIDKLAKKNIGKWEIIGTRPSMGIVLQTDNPNPTKTRTYVFNSFFVFDSGTELGKLSAVKTTTRSGDVVNKIRITSDRIDKKRGTANTCETSKPDVAVRIVMARFVKESKSEQLNKLHNTASSALASAVYTADIRAHKFVATCAHIASTFIADNMAAFKATYEKSLSPQAATLLETMPDALDIWESINTVESIKPQLLAVVIENGAIHVLNNNAPAGLGLLRYNESGDDAPEHIRRKVGMLKLIKDDQIVANIGMKITDTTFLITPEVVAAAAQFRTLFR